MDGYTIIRKTENRAREQGTSQNLQEYWNFFMYSWKDRWYYDDWPFAESTVGNRGSGFLKPYTHDWFMLGAQIEVFIDFHEGSDT